MAATSPAEMTRTDTPSKIYLYAGGLIEACWLAALIVVPLMHNPLALGQFEPNKAVFLRLLALIALVGVVVRWGEKKWKKLSWRTLGREPVIVGLAGWALAYGISTCCSIDSGLSLWGSPEHSQGAFTWLAQVVLAVLVAMHLRTSAQVHRLINVTVVTSVPIALYGLIQYFGCDPILFQDVEGRVFSRSGHPIALAAYLALVMPLVGWRLGAAIISFRRSVQAKGLSLAAIVFYSFLILIQGLAFLATGSRGPLLALAASALFFLIAWMIFDQSWRRFKMIWWGMGAAAIFLGILLWTTGGWTRVLSGPVLERFKTILPSTSGPKDSRVEFWRQAAALLGSKEPLPYPSGGQDSLLKWRIWIGYGPETLPQVLTHRYAIPVPNAKLENRFHNVIWDLWYSLGLGGVAAFLFVVLALFHSAYIALGWAASGRARFSGGMMAFGFGGAVAAGAWGGVGFAGLGLLAGLVTGLTVWPLLSGWRRDKKFSSRIPANEALFLLVLLAALIGHLIETGFAFSVADTSTQCWIYGGLIWALARRTDPIRLEAETESASADSSRWQGRARLTLGDWVKSPPVWISVFVAALILVTLLFGFLHLYSFEEISFREVLWKTLTQIKGDQGPSYLVFFLLIPTWLAASFVFIAEAVRRGELRHFAVPWTVSLLLSGLIAGFYLLLKTAQIVLLGPIPRLSDPVSVALRQSTGYLLMYLVFVTVVIGLLLIGGRWIGQSQMGSSPGSFSQRLMMALGLIMALVIGWFTSVRPMAADMAVAWANALMIFGKVPAGVAVHRSAVAWQPDSVAYRRLLADALIYQAENEGSSGGWERGFKEAEENLQEAQKRSHGLNESGYELGRLYLRWAAYETQPDQKLMRAQQADEALARAMIFQPEVESIWTDRGLVERLYLNQPKEAEQKIKKAQALVRNQRQLEWGDVYRDRSLATIHPELSKAYALHAIAYYQRGAEDPQMEPHWAARCRVRAGALYFLRLQEKGPARICFQQALATGVDEETWPANMMLAQIEREEGDRAAALRSVTAAIEKAPDEKKSLLLQLKQQIEF
jgi:hypothetical protein